MTERLRAVLDERRVQDAERALGNRRAQSEQGGSPGSDPPAENAQRYLPHLSAARAGQHP